MSEQNALERPGRAPGREEIEAAAGRLLGRLRRTPILTVPGSDLGLSGELRVTLKLELVQHTGSFKPRGALNRILSAELPSTGVLAASGGNHAQAVAWAARELGVDAEIFVPETAPAIKVARLHAYGARVVQVGSVYDEAREASEERARETGALVVHAYDQPEIVAGAGTLARELLEQVGGPLDAVLVAVGGGGLIGGTASWIRGECAVVAVEPERCPTLNRALAAGRPVPVEVGGLAADSLAARQIGTIPFDAARRWVGESVLVSDASIREAQAMLWDRFRLVAEPGGATALAGLLGGAWKPPAGSHVAALVCGANVDPSTLAGGSTS